MPQGTLVRCCDQQGVIWFYSATGSFCFLSLLEADT